jgi:hypothetical protein
MVLTGGHTMRAKITLGAIAAGCLLLFVLTPTQPEHVPYTAGLISKGDPTKSRLRSTLERCNMEIKGRLRWLGLLSLSSGYTASW